MHYGATAEEYRAWRDRPTGPPGVVRLVPLTPENYRAYGALATHHSQRRFVAPMLQSYADALFPEIVDGAPVVPRLRGIEADGEPAGFLMIAEASPAHPEPFLWRLLVDRMHQGRGIGRTALDLLVAGLRDEGHHTLLTSWQEGPGGPEPFYAGIGFTATGERHDGEVVARLDLDRGGS
jgi:GNAT superfamily N-acetyltransferase